VLAIVSEPWQFEAEVGSSRLLGRVSKVHGDDLVITLDAPVNFAGATIVSLCATGRYQGERATEGITRVVQCNFEGRDDAGAPLVAARLIGSLQAR
jgi:hypothetical protein